MKAIRNERGFVKFLFVTAVLVFLVYAGIQFGKPYYKYSSFKSDVKELARISLGDINRTKTQVYEKAQELRIPIEEDDIQVSKTEKTVRVKTGWSETVDILGLYQKKLDFTVDVEE